MVATGNEGSVVSLAFCTLCGSDVGPSGGYVAINVMCVCTVQYDCTHVCNTALKDAVSVVCGYVQCAYCVCGAGCTVHLS